MGFIADNREKRELAKTTGTKEDISYAEGLGKSFVWNFPGLIGVEAPKEVQRWEAQNPGSAFGAALAGLLVPYGGWAAASTKIPRLAKAMDAVGSTEKLRRTPFFAGAAKEVVRFAPFEAVRAGAAGVAGEEVAEYLGTEFRGAGEVGVQALEDLALAGVAGGTIEKVRSAGSKFLERKLSARQQKKASPQEKLKTLLDRKTSAPETIEDLDKFNAAINRLKRTVREQDIRPGQVYVGDVGKNTRDINRLFKPASSLNLVRRKFTVEAKNPNAFKSLDEVGKVATRAGWPKDWEALIQDPRHVFVRGRDPGSIKSTERHIRKAVQRNMSSVDSTRLLYMAKDKATGLHVMAQRLGKGEWVLWQTDSPGAFAPTRANFADGVSQSVGTFGRVKAPPSEIDSIAEVYNASVRGTNSIPVFNASETGVPRGNWAKMTSWLAAKTGMKDVADAELSQRLGGFVKDYLAPAQAQFWNNGLAAKGFAVARMARDAGEAAAERMFLGGRTLTGKKTLFGEIVAGAAPRGGLRAAIQELHKNPEQWNAVHKAIVQGLSPEEAVQKVGLDGIGIDFLRSLGKVNDDLVAAVQRTQEATGRKAFTPRPWHYGVSLTWRGDQRIPVYEGSRLLGYASGKSKREALEEADEIVRLGLGAGKKLHIGKHRLVGEFEENARLLGALSQEGSKDFSQLWLRANTKARAPTRLEKVRTGAIGFIGERSPWTKGEFEELVFKQLKDYQRYNARISTEAMLDDIVDALAVQDPQVAMRLLDRVDDVFGVQGPISKSINKATDKVLGPVLGKNSASKITGEMNRWLFRWTLGFFNAGFNTANALTFMQTAYPQISLLTHTVPERLTKYYTHYPTKGLQSTGGVGVLDMFKLTGRSFKEMAKPDALLKKHFGRAAGEGVWDPKFVEEWVGQSSTRVRDFGAVLKGDEGFANWIGAVADIVPSTTEKFARGHSFALGHILFRDIFNVTDDELLYQLTKEFVEKTQFLYSTADRAKIITGPLGSSFGLFKNWIMHYISWMLAYTGEAAVHGNWKPLSWAVGSTGALGGLGALPFIGLADDASELLSDKTVMENTYAAFAGDKNNPWGKEVADTVYYGLPAMFGFSIQNQVAAPFADPMQDASRLMSFAWMDRFNYAGKAIGQAIDHANATGEDPIRDKRTRDFMMRAFAPRTMYRLAQGIQDSTLRTLSTQQPVADLSLFERTVFGLGVNPINVESRFNVARELWKDQDKMKSAVSSAGKAWAQAIQDKDWTGANNVIMRAFYDGVDLGSVVRSGKAFLAKGEEDVIESRFSPEAILSYRKLGLY